MGLLAGCLANIGTVSMYGYVHDEPWAGGSAVEGATVETRDAALDVVGDATTDYDGEFAVDVPEGVDFFVEVRGEGYVPTHFSGLAGIYDFYSGDGYPWVAPVDWVSQVRKEFSSCASADDEGGIVTGEVRLFIQGAAPEDTPLIDSGEVWVYNSVTEEGQAACYLDDAGNTIPDGELTGATGRFAIFGVPAGQIAVEVIYHDPGGDEVSSHPQYYLAEGGVVPMYPAWAYVSAQ